MFIHTQGQERGPLAEVITVTCTVLSIQDNSTQHNSNYERRQMPTNERFSKGHNVKSGTVKENGMKCPSVLKNVAVWYGTVNQNKQPSDFNIMQNILNTFVELKITENYTTYIASVYLSSHKVILPNRPHNNVT